MSLEDVIRRMERRAVWLRGWLYAVRSDKRLPDPESADRPTTEPPPADVVQGAVIGHFARLERGDDGKVRGVIVETRTGPNKHGGAGFTCGVYFSEPAPDDPDPTAPAPTDDDETPA